MDLRGVFPPIPTPFRNGALDTGALAANCERWMETGLRGLVVLGSNGEAPLLDDDESDRVIAAARARVPADRLLIAGVARESTAGTERAATRAAACGADAVLVRTPWFFKALLSGEALTRHYTAVADASPVPVLLYNFTALTGVTLPVAEVARLARHPNIIGMKESGSDIAFISALIDETPDDFNVLAGSAPVFYASLVSGAAGGVLALACAVPELCVRLFDLVAAGPAGRGAHSPAATHAAGPAADPRPRPPGAQGGAGNRGVRRWRPPAAAAADRARRGQRDSAGDGDLACFGVNMPPVLRPPRPCCCSPVARPIR